MKHNTFRTIVLLIVVLMAFAVPTFAQDATPEVTEEPVICRLENLDTFRVDVEAGAQEGENEDGPQGEEIEVGGILPQHLDLYRPGNDSVSFVVLPILEEQTPTRAFGFGNLWELLPNDGCGLEFVMGETLRYAEDRLDSGHSGLVYLLDTQAGTARLIANVADLTDAQVEAVTAVTFAQFLQPLVELDAYEFCTVVTGENSTNVRSEANAESEVAGVLEPGTVLTVLPAVEGWYPVLEPIQGFVVETVVTMVGECVPFEAIDANAQAEVTIEPIPTSEGSAVGFCPAPTRVGDWPEITDVTITGPAIVNPWGSAYGDAQRAVVIPHGVTATFYGMRGNAWQFLESCPLSELESQAAASGLLVTSLGDMSRDIVTVSGGG